MAAAASQEPEAADATALPKAAARPGPRPYVNLSDMPELLPGAQPSANPAQREEFEQRAIKLHREAEREERETATARVQATGGAVTVADLEAMFPMLDAGLVNCIYADSQTPQAAIDTLLMLSADLNEPANGIPRVKTPPPRDVGVEDHEKFPSLTDSNGWQVASSKLFERDPDEELGSVWRDRAKDAAHLAAPKAAAAAASSAWGKPRKKKESDGTVKGEGGGYGDEQERPMPETDYEFRHRVGQRRAKQRLQYGRTGRGRGAAKSNGTAAGEDGEESEEESEELSS